ncbi:MAG: DASH complex subunit SPC19 [Aigarchaeota archaeon]|nr:DASH complex subunit SPC19 [Candidatus Calditenuis fumarioli]
MSIAGKLIEELERDQEARRRLAEILVTDGEVRLAIINAVLADVATKRDLETLRAELKADIKRVEDNLKALIEREISRLERRIDALENRVNSIEARLSRLEGQMNLFVKLFIAFNLPILLAVIGILLRLVFA